LLLSLVAVVPAADTSLVPTTPNTVPDYFCTWNVQGFMANYTNTNDQADQMIEANLFGTDSVSIRRAVCSRHRSRALACST
jgi:hypothetical protein